MMQLQLLLCAALFAQTDAISLKTDAATMEDTTGGPIMMVTFDHRYLPLWNCWAQALIDVNKKYPVSVVALDAEVAEGVKEWAKSHSQLRVVVDDSHVPDEKKVAMSMWPPTSYERLLWTAIQDRFKEGYSAVIKSDLDALLMRDPEPLLANGSDADMILAPDGYPPGNKHGSFNPGFSLFRNTPATKNVINGLANAWATNTQPKDGTGENDQSMLSAALNKLGCTEGLGAKWEMSNGYHRGQCGSVKLALFKDQILRGTHCSGTWSLCMSQHQAAYVYHDRDPMLKKKCGVLPKDR
eukprot:gb/GFBE01032289.1/.p1 GENE.gb/GFBE01032289.1/~~gb/GFBE01032289.1/.p1  ORF type:complete len:297 (+),score=54.40 gb/GFBE01032289.1/:1-891(+)